MILTASPTFLFSQEMQGKMAEKPLFRDSVYHGAADPNVIWNQKEQKWFMFYTNRLANVKGLDSVKTIDIAHDAGFSTGNIGFQLCHYHSSTSVDIKSLYIRETQ